MGADADGFDERIRRPGRLRRGVAHARGRDKEHEPGGEGEGEVRSHVDVVVGRHHREGIKKKGGGFNRGEA